MLSIIKNLFKTSKQLEKERFDEILREHKSVSNYNIDLLIENILGFRILSNDEISTTYIQTAYSRDFVHLTSLYNEKSINSSKKLLRETLYYQELLSIVIDKIENSFKNLSDKEIYQFGLVDSLRYKMFSWGYEENYYTTINNIKDNKISSAELDFRKVFTQDNCINQHLNKLFEVYSDYFIYGDKYCKRKDLGKDFNACNLQIPLNDKFNSSDLDLESKNIKLTNYAIEYYKNKNLEALIKNEHALLRSPFELVMVMYIAIFEDILEKYNLSFIFKRMQRREHRFEHNQLNIVINNETEQDFKNYRILFMFYIMFSENYFNLIHLLCNFDSSEYSNNRYANTFYKKNLKSMLHGSKEEKNHYQYTKVLFELANNYKTYLKNKSSDIGELTFNNNVFANDYVKKLVLINKVVKPYLDNISFTYKNEVSKFLFKTVETKIIEDCNFFLFLDKEFYGNEFFDITKEHSFITPALCDYIYQQNYSDISLIDFIEQDGYRDYSVERNYNHTLICYLFLKHHFEQFLKRFLEKDPDRDIGTFEMYHGYLGVAYVDRARVIVNGLIALEVYKLTLDYYIELYNELLFDKIQLNDISKQKEWLIANDNIFSGDKYYEFAKKTNFAKISCSYKTAFINQEIKYDFLFSMIKNKSVAFKNLKNKSCLILQNIINGKHEFDKDILDIIKSHNEFNNSLFDASEVIKIDKSTINELKSCLVLINKNFAKVDNNGKTSNSN